MLRLEQIKADGVLVVRAHGKLLEPWIAEVRAQLLDAPECLERRLDLSAVSFVDLAGARLIDQLRRAGIVVEGSSDFVNALLDSYTR